MFKIEDIEFKPTNDDDFVVTLRPLGFMAYQDMMMMMADDDEVTGPEVEGEKKKTSPERIKKYTEWVSKIFEHGVIKVKGCKLGDSEIVEWKGLLNMAPRQVVDAIVDKLSGISRPSEAVAKN